MGVQNDLMQLQWANPNADAMETTGTRSLFARWLLCICDVSDVVQNTNSAVTHHGMKSFIIAVPWGEELSTRNFTPCKNSVSTLWRRHIWVKTDTKEEMSTWEAAYSAVKFNWDDHTPYTLPLTAAWGAELWQWRCLVQQRLWSSRCLAFDTSFALQSEGYAKTAMLIQHISIYYQYAIYDVD